MKILNPLFCASALLLCSALNAQQPVPAKPQSKSVLIMNGTAHLGNGQVIENSVIGFKDGKIALVGDARTIRIAPGAWDTTINAYGKQVYPGFIAPNSTLGLQEVEAVRATVDQYEVGAFNSHIRALIAYNTDSKVTPTVRTNGVLTAQITPRAGRVTGSSSVVSLDGWNWEDAVLKADDGIHVNWPAFMSRNFTDEGPGPYEKNKNYATQLNELEKFFDDARAYCTTSTKPEEKNLRYEAMRGIFDGSKILYVHADYVKAITEAVAFAKRYDLKKLVIVGGTDSWQCTQLLKENNVSVMLNRVHDLPQRADADIDQPYKTAAQLQQAGVLFCLQNQGDQEATGARNIPFLAGTTVAYGLTQEQAIASISGNAAKIMGIDGSTGTLENGKDATVFISTGDALDMRTNNVINAWVKGRAIDLHNEQQELYVRYMMKYGLSLN